MKGVFKIPEGLKKLFLKYRMAILILLLGVLLLSLPNGREQVRNTETPAPVAAPEQPSVEAELEALLRQVEGAGQVSVMLSVEEGEYTVLQTDRVTEERTSEQGGDITLREETVFADAGSGRSESIPVQVRGPTYRGAVVVAEGADRASVRLDLISAVMSVTGLKADKITVIKMNVN
jgi:stage III sporulation protein AG